MSAFLQADTKKNRYSALLFLVFTAILWSLGGLWIKSVNLNPLAIAGISSTIASLLLLAVIGRPQMKFSWAKLGGAVSYAGLVFTFVSATKLTTAANAILIQYTAPVYVALFGFWFVKERATWFDWAIIVAVLGGMALFFLDELSAGGFWGNICAVVSGMFFAAMVLFMRRQKDESPLESVWLGNVLTALIGAPFAFGAAPAATDWVFLLLLGIFQLGLSYILYAAAIKRVTALEATLVPVLEPILNPV